MPFESPVFTRSQWRSHTTANSETLWVLGDQHCDAQLLQLTHDAVSLAEILRTISGHFAAVLVGSERIVLIADPIRSFPIFYSHADNVVRISDDVSILSGSSDGYVADYDSRVEFRHSAYVAGANTLYAGIYEVQAGESITMCSTGETKQEFYRQIEYSPLRIEETVDVDAHFTAALDMSMSRVLARAKGRQLVVPLSGGLDSRLLSIYLKDAGYENVVNFTYGTGKTREVLISQKVALALGQQWLFCRYDEGTIRSAWDTQETADFIKFAHAGASLPHIQDWYAVRWLKDQGLVDDDSMFLPGHTIVGNMHDEDILDAEKTSRNGIKELILAHHYTLQPDNSAAHKNLRLQRSIDALLDQIGFDGTEVSRLTALEYWNFRERQTKYINNSVRNYEFFGYEWALPMLDREVYLAWGDLHPNITRNRDWYEGYVNRRYGAATGQDLGTFAPNDVPKNSRDAIKRILGSVGLLRAVESFITARAVQNHPMGFNWFVQGMSPAELFAYTRSGGNLLGAYADEFLTDTWNSHCRLFTPEDTFH